MATQLAYMDAPTATIPLLDASDLPYADDWAVLEAPLPMKGRVAA